MKQGIPGIKIKTYQQNFTRDGDLTMTINASGINISNIEFAAPIFERAGVEPSKATIQKLVEIVGETNVFSQITYSAKGDLPYCRGYSYQISYEMSPMSLRTLENPVPAPTILTGVKALYGKMMVGPQGGILRVDMTTPPERLEGFPKSITMKGTVGRSGMAGRMTNPSPAGGDESLPPCEFLERGGWSDLEVRVDVILYFDARNYCLSGSNLHTVPVCYDIYSKENYTDQLDQDSLTEYCHRNGMKTLHDLETTTDPKLYDICACNLGQPAYGPLENQLLKANPALRDYSSFSQCYYAPCRASKFGEMSKHCGTLPNCITTGPVDETNQASSYTILGSSDCLKYETGYPVASVDHTYTLPRLVSHGEWTSEDDQPEAPSSQPPSRLPDRQPPSQPPSRLPDRQPPSQTPPAMPAPLPSTRPWFPENPEGGAIVIKTPSPPPPKNKWSFWQILLLVLMILIAMAAIGGFIYAITRPTKSRAILATSTV